MSAQLWIKQLSSYNLVVSIHTPPQAAFLKTNPACDLLSRLFDINKRYLRSRQYAYWCCCPERISVSAGEDLTAWRSKDEASIVKQKVQCVCLSFIFSQVKFIFPRYPNLIGKITAHVVEKKKAHSLLQQHPASLLIHKWTNQWQLSFYLMVHLQDYQAFLFILPGGLMNFLFKQDVEAKHGRRKTTVQRWSHQTSDPAAKKIQVLLFFVFCVCALTHGS